MSEIEKGKIFNHRNGMSELKKFEESRPAPSPSDDIQFLHNRVTSLEVDQRTHLALIEGLLKLLKDMYENGAISGLYASRVRKIIQQNGGKL